MKDKERELNDTHIVGLIDVGSEFKGELVFKGSFRIEGSFQGTIKSNSLLIIGEKGKVEADINVGQVVINGELRGTVQAAERVEIHGHGRVYGTIITPKLVVEEGAFLEANCQTTGPGSGAAPGQGPAGS